MLSLANITVSRAVYITNKKGPKVSCETFEPTLIVDDLSSMASRCY